VSARLVGVELVAGVDHFEERAADHDALAAQDLELALEPLRHPGRPPPELDDVDVVAARLEDVLPGTNAEPLVEHVREAAVAVDADIKGGHRAPPTSLAHEPG